MESPKSLDAVVTQPESTPTEKDCISPKAPRRINVACLRCRERKVRCSGTSPCDNCTRRSSECVFAEEHRRVTVSEKYLSSLKRKAGIDSLASHQDEKRYKGSPAAGMENQPGIDQDRDNDTATSAGAHGESTVSAVSPEEDGISSLRNPLVATPSKFLTDDSGRRRFLGPSSTWAYSRHVMSMIKHYLCDYESPEVPLHVDGSAIPLQFPNIRQAGNTLISMRDMPSIDYAIYLTNTVKFHVSQTHHIFDEPSFMRGLYSLYNDGPRPATSRCRLWYVQYLVIMGFGKALLIRGGEDTTPAGSEYFMRALELLPDVNGLYQDPLLSVEICCGLALYLQSVDHRNSAYVYLGLGFRIALSQGYHRDLLGDSEGADFVRQRSAWWTLYVLDRKLSSLMGAPSSIHDSDITAPLPDPQHSAQKATALDMHVKLSRLIAKVLNTVYGVDGRLDSSFLANIQIVLHELANMGTELNANPELGIEDTGTIGRVPATLNLCYHQCIVLATRPLLVCLLRNKLEERARSAGGSTEPSRPVSEPIKALLKTTYDSAQKSLLILDRLRAQHLLELFLPFDLDHAFSASFVLTMLSALQPFPEGRIDDGYAVTANALLDEFVSSGSVPARFRREELKRLRQLLFTMSAEFDESLSENFGIMADAQGIQGDVAQTFLASLQVIRQGASPNQVLNVANLFENYPPLGDVETDILEGTDWLWGTY